MEANDFITKLKADGSANDLRDLDKVYTSFKELLGKVQSKLKGTFSLNVLCILCRNIDKVPSWCEKINGKALLNLSIDCVRQTRGLDKPERIKVLACVYHIHKFVVRQPSQPPPELVLKLSYMPFECVQDNLLTEYSKTYWNLLADRLMFIEKFKSGRRAIIKLLPKLIEAVQKVISMYDSVQFCNTILVFLVKKLHFLYSTEHANDLNGAFGIIFDSLSLKKDVKAFKKLSEKELLELYVKLNDCFYVIAENATKFNCKDSVLTETVRSCISFIGHAPELYHCLQTFYLNAFCCILTDNGKPTFNETVLNSLIMSCESTEMGYAKAMEATYPYINQLLRVYIEYSLSKTNLTEDWQETCLKLVILLLDKLKNTEQLLICDNCKIKSGLHDALRLSFLAKNFVSACLKSKLDVTVILQPYLMIIQKQHSILTDLCRLGCSNHEKCLRKLQTDIYITAILLNRASYYDWAIQLLDLYLKHEFLHFKTAQDLKNISRALYYKSICEMDNTMYEKALLDGFLSLVFAQPDGLSSEKNMSLVMDVKARAVKGSEDEELQMMTVLDACRLAVDRELYGNLKPFFYNLDFGTLLQHEFNMYARLWPSLSPVAGVWRSLHFLATGERLAWMCAQPDTLDTLCSIILQTASCVRTIHNPHLSAILSSILDTTPTRDNESSILDNMDSNVKWSILDKSTSDVKWKVTMATIMFLKAEMDLTDAAVKYEWNIKDQIIDPDLVPCCRTLEQEHKALKPTLQAVTLWTEVLPRLDDVPLEFLAAPLLVLRAVLQQLLHARRAPALQLAHVALRVSQWLGDRAAYLEAAGIILSHAHQQTEQLRRILTLATQWAARLMEEQTLEPALVFLCDAAIFYHNTKQPVMSAKLIRVVQARILPHVDSTPLAVGRLLDAQALSLSDLSASVNALRHYFTVGNNEITWCLRQRRTLLLKHRTCVASLAYVALSRSLRLGGRARAATACALGAAAAETRVILCALAMDPSRCDTARATLDQRLKHIVGLQSNECALQSPKPEKKATAPFTPQPQVDIMRDSQTPKKHQTSPSIPIEYVAAFKTPEFFDHDSKCQCYACENPSTSILASLLLGLEASVYFRAKECDVAKNYFDGVLASFWVVENKLKASVKKLREKSEKYIVDIIEKMYEKELLNVELEVLIEAAYFELSQKNYSKSDDYIYVRINEILQAGDVDGYTKNEVTNLMTASEALRKADMITDRVADIENDFDNLKLTPTKEILKTPELKPTKPPVFSKVVVSKEELPDKKCKIPTLNLDEPEEQVILKEKNFKIPGPITTRPDLENITPRPRPKVKILVTQPAEGDIDLAAMTPQTDKSKVAFFTPVSTPDQFFTPQTSVKTYSKQEFSSKEKPKSAKGNLEKELKVTKPKESKQSKTEAAKADLEMSKNLEQKFSSKEKPKSAEGNLEKELKVTKPKESKQSKTEAAKADLEMSKNLEQKFSSKEKPKSAEGNLEKELKVTKPKESKQSKTEAAKADLEMSKNLEQKFSSKEKPKSAEGNLEKELKETKPKEPKQSKTEAAKADLEMSKNLEQKFSSKEKPKSAEGNLEKELKVTKPKESKQSKTEAAKADLEMSKNLEQKFSSKEKPKSAEGNLEKELKVTKPKEPKQLKTEAAKADLEMSKNLEQKLSSKEKPKSAEGNLEKELKVTKPKESKQSKTEAAKADLEMSKNLEQKFSSKEKPKSAEGNLEKELKVTKPKESKQLKTEAAKVNSDMSKEYSKIESAKNVVEKKGRVETGCLKTLNARGLKRATSPGKLPKVENPKSRLRRPAVRVERDENK